LEAVAAAHRALDLLAGTDLSRLTDDELLDYGRVKERLARRLPSLDHAFILEVEARGLPAAKSVRTTAQLLRGLLRLDPYEAAGRVRAAEAAGRRRTLTGESLPPAYPAVAAAQAAGEISAQQARVIVDAVEKLPDAVRPQHATQVEDDLVRYAHQFDAHLLAQLGRRIHAHLDPDGTLPDVDERHRRRDLALQVRPDGSSHGEFDATAELTELLLTHFDALAAPQPERDGVKDPRTPGQRRHDALLESLKLVLRAELLPTVTGVTATIVVTMTDEAYRTGKGLARTSHGSWIPTQEALGWAGGDMRLMAVVMNSIKGVTAYSSAHRLFTEAQRLAMDARDGGCTFPGCSAPAGRCQAMHLTAWVDGGRTSVDNGALGCHYDHRERTKQGWQVRLVGHRIGWVPPRWIDPQQQPRFNDLHQPVGVTLGRPPTRRTQGPGR
jgi:hypothetical protein